MKIHGMEIETFMSWVLRAGVVISVLLLAAGLALIYSSQGAAPSAGTGLLIAGIFVLFMTPIARVLLSIFAFAIEGNRLYMIITLIVFINIMFAIFVVPFLLGV